MHRRPRSKVPIDLLPDSVRAEQHTRRRFTIAAGGAVVLLVVLALVTTVQRLQINDAKGTLQSAQTEAATLQQQVAGLHEFEALQVSLDQTRQTLGTVLATDLQWSRFLDDLDTVMPTDAWLVNMSMSATPGSTPLGETSLGTVQYQGFVKSFPGLSGWLDTMSKQNGLRFVYLTNGQRQEIGGQQVVSFNASTHITESMLSGRCQKEDTPCP
jgi:Tfp pilus assembly protein PilN